MELRVHRIPHSTNVERVALALAHKGLAVDWVDVDPADRSPLVALSGQDLVPVLEAGRRGDRRLDGDPRLARGASPGSAAVARGPRPQRAATDIAIDWFNAVWKVAPNAIDAELGAARAGRRRDRRAVRRRWPRRCRWFEALLDGRDFLLGDALGGARRRAPSRS